MKNTQLDRAAATTKTTSTTSTTKKHPDTLCSFTVYHHSVMSFVFQQLLSSYKLFLWSFILLSYPDSLNLLSTSNLIRPCSHIALQYVLDGQMTSGSSAKCVENSLGPQNQIQEELTKGPSSYLYRVHKAGKTSLAQLYLVDLPLVTKLEAKHKTDSVYFFSLALTALFCHR